MPSPNATGTNDNKRWIFHQEKGLAESDSWPMVFKGVIKIPKKFHRMGAEDQWQLKIQANNNYEWCGIAIYKWYK